MCLMLSQKARSALITIIIITPSSLHANPVHSFNTLRACLSFSHLHMDSYLHSSLISYLLQINILLNFSAGEDCPCPEEIQEELNSFHEELRLHCGKVQHLLHQYFWFHLCVLFSLARRFSLKLSHYKENPTDFDRLQCLKCCLYSFAGIPIEEEEEDQDTSIKGRLLALLYKIKGPPQKAEKEPEKEQAAPSK